MAEKMRDLWPQLTKLERDRGQDGVYHHICPQCGEWWHEPAWEMRWVTILEDPECMDRLLWGTKGTECSGDPAYPDNGGVSTLVPRGRV